jgi:hypothetical protein
VDWLRTEIITGFQKLLCLSLDRTPASELLPGTVNAWTENLARLAWDEGRDRERVRLAFVKLQGGSVWPRVPDFIAALPPLSARLALPAKVCDPEQAQANIDRIKQLLAEPVHDFVPAPEPKPEREQSLAELETYLKTHYDGKRKAAGDV